MLFSRSRRPLTSTLFPYTTLFRSRQLRIHHQEKTIRHQACHRDQVAQWIERHVLIQMRVDRDQTVHAEEQRIPDRKSTRLNSSHEWISYAVFCLKKKNTTKIEIIF